METHPPTQLWYPGANIQLDTEYPVPTADELIDAWDGYLQSEAHAAAAPGVYGVVRVPETSPSTFISVDVCEVLRQTHATLRTVEEPFGQPIPNIHDYCGGMKSVECNSDLQGKYADIKSIAQVLMGENLIQPVEGIERITSLMQSWREKGVYIFANTSTLEGCEMGTISFFRKYMPDALDGLLFPRNFDGLGKITKGVAAANVVEAFRDPATETTAIHIDDLGHHLSAFHLTVGALSGIRVATYQPAYPSVHQPHAESLVTGTPLETFQQLDTYLKESLAPSGARQNRTSDASMRSLCPPQSS